MHSLPIAILSGTPVWVYAMFALLLHGGLRQWTPRSVPLARFLFMPSLFIAWGVHALTQRSAPPDALLHWLAMAVLGAMLAPRLLPAGVHFDATGGAVQWPGSPVPLLRNLLLFGVRYGAHVLAVLQPSHAAHWLHIDLLAAGFGAGFFVGWVLAIVRARPAFPSPIHKDL